MFIDAGKDTVTRADLILLLDNKDSFVWNLAQALETLGAGVDVVRSDAVDVDDVGRYEAELLDFMRSSKSDILEAIESSGKFEDETEQKLIAALDEFGNVFQATATSAGGEEAA